MADTVSPPLYQKFSRKNHIHRALDICILFLLTSLIFYRLLTLKNHGFAWLLALLCESWFTFVWVLTVSTKWNPVDYKTYPERLPQRVEKFLPAVDMFVTTADPVLEPPIITMNTVISLLAVDYPANKLACYLSDDGCSPLTFYSLLETSKFAKLWVPFCKKYNIQVRAPFRYFSSTDHKPMLSSDASSLEFQQEWKKMKIMWENKEGVSNGLPHLIYVSREKRPNHPHHYKAGAMNVLTRVSGLITNAPFMLNVDCDMFVNNPQIVRHAMCFFLGSKNEGDTAFVQTPQIFYDGLKDDPFGNQLVVLYEYMGRGIVGLQGPFYGGTGCFRRRKVIYGLCPNDIGDFAKFLTPVTGNLDDKELLNIFGNSKEFITSAANALEEKTNRPNDLSDSMEAAYHVAACGYEYGTAWGKQVGWQYGSTTEDVLTGLKIHGRGWRSVYCKPDPPAFLGCAPSGGPTSMTQQKRWATGLLEILVSKRNPIFATIFGKLQLRQCLAYLWIFLWGLRSIPELCYMVLPAYCIITNSNFLPKVNDPAIHGYIALLIIYNTYTLLEYLQTGLSIRAWWNKQRMAIITSTGAWLFGVLSVILKILGISDTVFEVTQKEQSTSDAGRFTFDGSPIFVPGTTLLLLHLASLVMGLFSIRDGKGLPFGEMSFSLLVLICFWPFLKGLFGRGKYGIPLSTICKSVIIVSSFVYLCKHSSMG
ncbi:hypothetical protein JCGZ_13715 [Jatropha curcas]|uniref:Cellulose synthase-like protein H1 n=1 Tax=Jatropha curcas TaxID=180498 RepID=A0A067K3U5_JATCU|nr:hypothetical protein JCGZ_13715 [Jatropha curcas]